METKVYNVLFLCTGNSARSVIAEVLLDHWGRGRFRGFSAGSFPKGAVHQLTLQLLERLQLPTTGLRSKSWDEFADPGAPVMDFVLTVCDQAAGEVCPVWPGTPITAHWGVPDPAAVDGGEDERWQAFRAAARQLEARDQAVGVAADRQARPAVAEASHRRDRPFQSTGEAVSSVTDIPARPAAPSLGTFERYLTLWVALCILTGIVLGRVAPGPFQALGRLTVAEVNIPVAVLIWLMIVPMLLKVDFGALHRVAEQWRGIAVTVGVNWLVKPFSMAALGWLFVGWLFRPLLPPEQIDSYIAGLILLAAAPCTAMVFVWSNLTDGDPNFTLTQVALNDTIMVFAFAPVVALLLGMSSIAVPWQTLFLSVLLYIVVPVVAAQLWRRSLIARGGEPSLRAVLQRLQPVSLVALLATLVLLFGFQGEQIVRQPLVILLLAVPIVIQVYLNAGIAYGLDRVLGVPHRIACPSALIGASNFFELAVAAAIALFGFQSGAALATVVGVLVEVPVMLSVVRIVLRTRDWYEGRAA